MHAIPQQTAQQPESRACSWEAMARPIICLAPMDGITDSAYRQVVRRISPQVVLFSEFTSADGFLRSERVRQRLEFKPEEQPYFVQLFGASPAAFREAALVLEAQGVSGVDINMGCPAKKIVHSQHGSSLMRDPAAACRIVEAVARACRIQVSVKTRLGWEDHHGLIPFIRSLASAGASLITIHGRTYRQGFSGQANWGPIYALKRSLGSVPVLGNGDVEHLEAGLGRLGNLDGVMIGRAAIGNPWVFAPGGVRRQLSMAARVAVMRDHFQRMWAQKGSERQAVIEFRKHLAGYLRGFPLAKQARITMLRVERATELHQQLEALQAQGAIALPKAG